MQEKACFCNGSLKMGFKLPTSSADQTVPLHQPQAADLLLNQARCLLESAANLQPLAAAAAAAAAAVAAPPSPIP